MNESVVAAGRSKESAGAPAWFPMGSPELAVVIPTFKESENIGPLLSRLQGLLAGLHYEVIFVDDHSPDGTAAIVRQVGRGDSRVRCLLRIGRRGLASAVIEGVLATNAEYVAVMDADLQHDESLLPKMLVTLKSNKADVVVASRYMDGGGVGNWTQARARMSKLATRLSKLILAQDLQDPMSGFFMTRRDLFEEAAPRLSAEGYKILLDYLASSPKVLRCAELPYTFRNRLHGESKLDSLVLWEYGMLLADKLIGHIVPPRFLLFGIVGGTGVLVHFAVLSVLYKLLGFEFNTSQAAATLVAMTTNFLLNNSLTYRDKRLRGWRWGRGLVTFYTVCSVGAAANVGVASVLFAHAYTWWISGLAGILVGTVFNFAMTSVFTWGKRR